MTQEACLGMITVDITMMNFHRYLNDNITVFIGFEATNMMV
jgi:hypothetical protein